MKNDISPVALFVFNRPEELKETLAALKDNYLAKDTDIYIFSDGPRNLADEVKVHEVREVINDLKGFKSVSVSCSEINRGLASSVISGVSKILTSHTKVIVLEDDLISSQNFLDFMNQALDFYECNSSILSISGFNFLTNFDENIFDNYFFYRASSWGWATWKKKWFDIDYSIPNAQQYLNSSSFRKQFNKGGSDLSPMLQNQLDGKIDSWAIRFCFHQHINNMITVFPKRSKIINIGFSNNATHTKYTNDFDVSLDHSGIRKFRFSNDLEIKKNVSKKFQLKYSIRSRIKRKIIQLIYSTKIRLSPSRREF